MVNLVLEMSTNWCKNMSITAKKPFKNPAWVLVAGLFILAGCQGDASSGIGSDDSQTAQQDQSTPDDTQETTSQPGTEDSVAEPSPGEETATEDELVDDGTSDSDSGTSDSDGGTSDGGDSTPSVDTTATLMWDAPAERENGDSLKVGEIDYYVVSWGQDPDTLANTQEVSCVNCTDMEHVIEDLDAGTWYFTVQTRDTEGNVSRQADLATKKI